MTPEDYANLVENTYNLIIAEIELCKQKSNDDRQALYPNLIVMYEFFRCLRGEAFFEIRPMPTPEGKQDIFYKMEYEIHQRLKEIKNLTDVNSERTKYYLDQMLKEHFEV